MNKTLTLLAALFCAFFINAQDKVNLVVFSEDGDAFYAYINGIRQNDKPETNVKVTGVSPNISLRIVFENKTLPELKQNMALEAGFEHTARIKKDTKQQVKLRYFGQVPLGEEPKSAATTIAYHTSENPVETNNAVNNTSGGSNSYTTTTTTTRSNPDNVSVNISVGAVGMNMNVTTTETAHNNITTTSSSTVTSGSSSDSKTATKPAETAAPAPAKAGCTTAMSPSGFATMKQSIESKPFSDTKMSTARVATKNACLSTSQVKEICKLFNMDDDKLAYAKYAYNYCVDKANYYQVSEVFSFSSTTDDFNKFLEQ
jgi:hypothetical protein